MSAEFNVATSTFQVDLIQKFVQIKINDIHFDKAINLIKNHTIHSADALLVAASLYIADERAPHNDEFVFVTSDAKAYQVALAESSTRSNYTAYNFWKCCCDNCNKVIDIKKYNTITCPHCNTQLCNPCNINNCNRTVLLAI